jgi:outer membrane protein assembly factor BamB
MSHAPACLCCALLLWVSTGVCPAGQNGDEQALAGQILAAADLPGGLCVHLGCASGALTVALSDGGRFLVHGLEPDAVAAEAAIRFIRSRGAYGQVWVEPYGEKHLPYAENLVNLLVADDIARTDVPVSEIMRVLCPGGVAYLGRSEKAAIAGIRLDAGKLGRQLARAGATDVQTIERRGVWAWGRKPRPAEMDAWGQPRHGPSGNAVSLDALVGPPRRVRWLAGPMIESSNIVTAGGRFFHGGIIARDAFNGLPLWQRQLEPTPLRLGYPATAIRGSVLPIATADRLYVVTGGELLSLDAATGRSIRAYVDAAMPSGISYDSGIIFALYPDAVRALDAASGRLLWSYEAALPAALVSGDGGAFLLEGDPARGDKRSIVKRDVASGAVLWRQSDLPWNAKVRHLSYHKGLLVCEVSTFSNDRPGNGIHVLDARNGKQVWQRLYEPGQNHYMQARALQTDDRLWLLCNGYWEGLDRRTGTRRETYPAGPNHCFPPVATPRYLIGEEMSFTDIRTGRVDANRIAKGACSRDTGFVPANGLLYVAPKHCACYPMLKGFTALAPAKSAKESAAGQSKPSDFVPQRGPAWPAAPGRPDLRQEWPLYRADIWRSASTSLPVPPNVEVLWTADIGDWPKVSLAREWKENLCVRGPITAPVVAHGRVFVAQPDGHRVVALDESTGRQQWDFTANGRIDTPPTIAADLCLFGTSSGWVYCLQADDGRLVWRLRAAPQDERIISFGQLESPWPVPGSILVVDATAYFAAGRQPLADGGILVCAADPASGQVNWVKTIASLPMKKFYAGDALEFDCFDLLVAEARRSGPAGDAAAPGRPDCITMSRWQIDLVSGQVDVAWHSGFGYFRTAGAGVLAPRGLWTYGQRMDYIASGPSPGSPDHVASTPRPLAAFRGATLYASSEDKRHLFRRNFSPEDVASFDDTWYTQQALPRKNRPGGDRDRAERLARGAAWTREVFPAADRNQAIGAVLLAGEVVFVAGTQGRLIALAAADGKVIAERALPAPVWDGLAASGGRLYVSTADGKVICLGASRSSLGAVAAGA